MTEEGTTPDRDVGAFDRRAESYEEGGLGSLHRAISDRVVSIALTVHPEPLRVLDIGSGTGYLLRNLAPRAPAAAELTGIDPAPNMVNVARSLAVDPRLRFDTGMAEHLPYPDAFFDLVVTTTSFDHWRDQAAGIRECARVLADGGHLVLTDQFSPLLLSTLLLGRRGKARTRRRTSRLLDAAGFERISWRRVYAVIISTVVAVK